MRIDVASVSDKNGLDRVYILLNSLKKTKKDDTVIHYRLVLEDLNDEVKQYFKDLQSEDFVIQYIDTDWFKQRINSPRWSYLYYVRCLFPTYFKSLDKLLYLDTDAVFLQGGVECLWETDITNYSFAAVSDIMVNIFPNLRAEKNNCETEFYINSGVCLFNLKRMRQNDKAKELVNWVFDWKLNLLKPYLMDQSLLNYLFRNGEIKQLDFKYNDYSLVLNKYVFPSVSNYLKQKYGYQEPIQSVKDAVIIHFLGEMKPWKKNNEKTESISPYVQVCKQVWKKVVEELGKKDEAKEISTI